MMGRMALDVLRSALVRMLSRRRRRRPSPTLRLDHDDANDYDVVHLVGGRVMRTHAAGKCLGPNCCIHNPSAHALVDAPLHWRADRALMERICSHGIGHPDPDSLAFLASQGVKADDVHGCDGCC